MSTGYSCKKRVARIYCRGGRRRKTDKVWVAANGSHTSTVLGCDVNTTRKGGSALDVAYLCNHETEFRGWNRGERVRRVHFLRR